MTEPQGPTPEAERLESIQALPLAARAEAYERLLAELQARLESADVEQ